MPFKLGNWVKHPHFGHGQIVQDCDSSLVIRFIAQGEKKITKEFQITSGTPPHPGFTYPKARYIKRPRSKDMAKEPKCFTCEKVFPFIQEVMERLCKQFGKAEHDAIVDESMRHPEPSGIVELAVARCPHLSKRGITSNMVQWMSQHYTQGHEDADVFAERFQRHKDSRGRWAYSLR
jgi:hypothetical protein